MASFLGLNTGAEDSMLIDAQKSYFTHQPWVPSSNFVRELKDIEPTNVANFGTTVFFTIDRAGDLLGNLDLELDFSVAPSSDVDLHRYLVDGFGYAMVDNIKFSIGHHKIQEHSGEWLYLQNALTKKDEKTVNDYVMLDHDAITKSEPGREYIGSMQVNAAQAADTQINAYASLTVDSTVMGGSGTHLFRSLRPGDRVYYQGAFMGEVWHAGLTALAFTLDRNWTPSVAVVTDQRYEVFSKASPRYPGSPNINASSSSYGEIQRVAKRVIRGNTDNTHVKMGKIILPLGLYFSSQTHRHLPLEAISHNQEIKVAIKFKPFNELCFGWDVSAGTSSLLANSSTARAVNSTDVTIQKMVLKAQYFHLMGPEASSLVHRSISYICALPMHQGPIIYPMTGIGLTASQKVIQLSMLHPIKELFVLIRLQKDLQGGDAAGERGRNYWAFQGNPDRPANMDDPMRQKILMESMELELNGNKTHPVPIERDYLVKRLMAQAHTCGYSDGFVKDGGTEEIYALHFGLSPESLNPSGHLNFTKASNPKLILNLKKSAEGTTLDGDHVHVDIYANYYNWIIMDKGRAHLAFH
jgi:hypothetical protein